MSLSLEQLRDIFNLQFGEPYLVENGVVATLENNHEGKMLSIQIGRRDIQINDSGEVVGAGTLITMPDDVLVFNQTQ